MGSEDTSWRSETTFYLTVWGGTEGSGCGFSYRFNGIRKLPEKHKRFDEVTMEILPFDFSGTTLRVFIDEFGNPWWVGKEICVAAGIKNHRMAPSRLDPDEKKVVRLTDPLGKNPQKTILVNEPGLYNLLLGSRKPSAQKFKKWVRTDVLPQVHLIDPLTFGL